MCTFKNDEGSRKRKKLEILEIELFTALKFFEGAVKTQQFMGTPSLFELVAVVS